MSTYTDASLIVTPNGKKAGKLYALKGADLDVVRAATATYVGSDGLIKTALANEVRFDYTNGSCPSILVEPQRTNLVTYSEQFDNASWTKTRATITSNATTAPDGTLTADKLILSVDNNSHFIQQTGISVTAQIYSATVYAKKAEYDTVRILLANYWSPTPSVIFNLTTKSIVSTASATGKITELNDGWFKLDITATINAAAGGNAFFSIYGGNNGIISLVGDGTSGIYIWGAQLEAGANATSYIPTIASTVTRNADVISKTGISDLIGQTEGTVLCDINLTKLNSDKSLFTIDNGTANEYIALIRISSNIFRIRLKNSSGAAVTLINSIVINDARCKIGIAYKNGDYAMYINGVLRGTSTNSTNYPTTALTQFILSNASYGQLNDSYNSVALWKERLSNETLATLTTI